MRCWRHSVSLPGRCWPSQERHLSRDASPGRLISTDVDRYRSLCCALRDLGRCVLGYWPSAVNVQELSALRPLQSAFKGAPVQRISVVSSNLASVGYELHSRTLEVQFKNGGIYRYSGVPESVYRGLMNASSKGGYLDAFVKKAGYPVARIV